jgi:uncharacterized membrane protein HdeD (DUF308 family)
MSATMTTGAARADGMSARLAENWWALALRGALAVVFGILTFLMPGVTLTTLLILFAAYLFADGVMAIVAAVRAARKDERWGWLVFEGLTGIAAAIAFVLYPGLTIVLFIYLAAAWAIVSGVTMAVAAFRLNQTHGRWMMAIAGIFSVVFGTVLLVAPIAGAVALTLWLGAYALIFGAALLVLAVRLRGRRASSTVAGSTPSTA